MGEGTVILLTITLYAITLMLLLRLRSAVASSHWRCERLTFLSADTHTVVQDQVYMGQLCHHAGSFKERLKENTEPKLLLQLFQSVKNFKNILFFFWDAATD